MAIDVSPVKYSDSDSDSLFTHESGIWFVHPFFVCVCSVCPRLHMSVHRIISICVGKDILFYGMDSVGVVAADKTITKTRLFTYIENFTTIKIENFQIKNPDIYHISAQNIDCGYSLEPPHRGGSNEYPQSMFRAEIRKIMYTPVNPSFTV